MTLRELREHLIIGREIEFRFEEQEYFVSHEYTENRTFYIWDEKNKCILIRGSIDDILNYCFSDAVSFSTNIERFVFDYIL